MKKGTIKALFKRNVWEENQVLRQILGICSLLAVTNLVSNSLVMGGGLIFSVALSSFTISFYDSIFSSGEDDCPDFDHRCLGNFFDIILKAVLPDERALGPYIGLIITTASLWEEQRLCFMNPPVESFLMESLPGLVIPLSW